MIQKEIKETLNTTHNLNNKNTLHIFMSHAF